MPAQVAQLYRYPVKGLNAEPMEMIDLTPGAGIPHDRRFAIARAATDLDPAAPRWLPRTKFVVLLSEASLARLRCRFDDARVTLELSSPRAAPVEASVHSDVERRRLDDLLNASIDTSKHGRAHLVECGTLSFTDIPENCLSLVNLETIRDLEQRMGTTLHPLRFRANVYIAGLPAWQEMSWLGQAISLGSARLRVASQIPRCATTHVNPETAERDLNVVKALKQAYGHHDLGVYAEVTAGGRVAIGDALQPDGAAPASRLGRWAEFVRFWTRNGVKFVRRR